MASLDLLSSGGFTFVCALGGIMAYPDLSVSEGE